MSAFADRHREENRGINALAKRLGGAVEQPIDLDDPPMRCGCEGCKRDAVLIIRLHVGSPREFGITACPRHTTVARTAAYEALS